MPERFVLKGPEIRSQQIEKAEAALDTKRLLLPPSPARADLLAMSGEELRSSYPVRYEAYLKALRHPENPFASAEEQAPFFHNNREQFLAYLEILNGLDEFVFEHQMKEEEGEGVMFEKQVIVFQDIAKHLEAGQAEGYVTLPTGFGKTVIFSQMIEATQVPTVIVTPTRALVDQTYKRLKEFAPSVEPGKVYGGKKERDAEVIVTTYDAFQKDVQNGVIDPKRIQLLVLDEAHSALTTLRKNAVQAFTNAVKIGFTATPEFFEEKKVEQLLPVEYHHMGVREGIEEGYLAQCRSLIVQTHVDLTKVGLSRGEYNQKELQDALNIHVRNKAAVDLYEQAFKGKGAIAFCIGVEHAKLVCKEFEDRGIRAAVVSGDTPPTELEKSLKLFEAGEIDVLANAKLLTEGFDSVRASVCLNLNPTRSKVRAEQRAGRVLRLNAADRNKWGVVVDFLDQFSDGKNPVLYTHILEGAVARTRQRAPERTKGGEESSVEPDWLSKMAAVSLEGVDVSWDEARVVEVVREVEAKDVKYEARQSLRFVDFLKQVHVWADELRRQGRTPSKDAYAQSYKDHLGWPSTPRLVYAQQGWKGWPDLFEKAELLSFENFLGEVRVWADRLRSQGITPAVSRYWAEYEDHPGWPSKPSDFYQGKGWKSWPDLFGKERIPSLPFDECLRQVRVWAEEQKRGGVIVTREIYEAATVDHPGWPVSPAVVYKKSGWEGWPHFFGRENLYGGIERRERRLMIPFEQFRIELQTWAEDLLERGIMPSVSFYLEEYKKHAGWPVAPAEYYEDDGWASWSEMLGEKYKQQKEQNQFLLFEKLLPEVREWAEKKRTAGEEPTNYDYRGEQSKHLKWPSTPEHTYKNKGWVSWDHFFDKQGGRKREFEGFKEQIRDWIEGLRSRGEEPSIERYAHEYRDHPGWVASPLSRFKHVGWTSWIDLFGKERTEYLPFEQFISEVQEWAEASRAEGKKVVHGLYKTEYKKHKGWPSNPEKVYKDWKSWPDLWHDSLTRE